MKKSYCLIALLAGLFLVFIARTARTEETNPLAPYPSPTEMVREIYDLAQAHPDRVEVSEYGQSVQGRPLLVMYIHRPGETKKPAGWIGGNIHGNEWIGNRMAMGIAHLLVEQDGTDPRVTAALDAMAFYIAPCLNPDGYEQTWQTPHPQDTPGLAKDRKNAHGVDLNRNFPLPGRRTIPIAAAGSPKPESVNYRGPAPLSEPETKAIDLFFQTHPEIVGAISFHSTAAVLYPPHCASHACVVRHKRFCRAFRENQAHRRYPRLQSRIFDTYTGELEDWLYAEYGVIAMDVEIGRPDLNQQACQCDDLFWTYNPRDPQYWIENDAHAAVAALLEAVKITGGTRIPRETR